ncbi:MAG: molybdopterin oxidoreductase family protein [Nitrospinales bacterium]
MNVSLFEKFKSIVGWGIQKDKYRLGTDPQFGIMAEEKIPERWVPTTCGYCSVGCGLYIGVRDGKAVSVKGDPRHPVNRGVLCPKGLTAHYSTDAPGRALYPLQRDGKTLKRVGWDRALSAVSERFLEIQKAHGPQAVATISTGQLVTEEFYALGKLMQLGLGTSNYDGNTTLCMASAVSGYKRSFGSDGPPGCYADLEQADCIFLIGANIADCHPILYSFMERNPKKTVIVADPRISKTAMKADLYLPLKPRTDLALLYGMMQVLIQENLIDDRFIAERTSGFEELREFLADYSLPRVAEITGLREGVIYQAALAYGRARAGFAAWSMGVNQSVQGTATVNAINTLALITGNVGVEGGAPFSITGQCNAMGSRETSFTSSLPGYREFENPEHRKELAALWQVDETRIPQKRGKAYPDIINDIVLGRIRALWIIGTNPMVSFPNKEFIAEALSRLDFLVVQDGFHPTPTSELCDVFLPAAIWGEKEGTYTNSERRASKVNRAVPPPGEAKTDFEIFLGLARKLGCDQELFPGWNHPRDAFNEWKRVSRGRLCDYSGMDYEGIELRRGIQWPCPESSGGGAPRLYADGPFPTPDGRAKLWSVPWEPFYESGKESYPFILNTGRTVEHWHTRTKTGNIPSLNNLAPEAWLEISPHDARKLKIRQNQYVSVTSQRGRIEAIRVRVTSIVRQGEVFIPFHYAETSANQLTFNIFDPISRQPNFKQCAVAIEP